ncbi:MAG TPA: AAA family ATPase [Phycisphaerae bacterium]|nr:AAA family ATPase [Phycisphaerae bacterium]HUU22047.1 AAA family ATPase [Phycisphaerae bacterium]
MYLEFFKLTEFPFGNGCDERFYFASELHVEALANMVYTVRQRRGMVLITGEVGAGKTFLGSMLAGRLGLGATVVTISHPPSSPRQLLRALLSGLGVNESQEADKLTLAEQAEAELERQFRRHRTVALVLDEAQALPDEALEEVRMLWNWERQGHRLLQIVLIGQPELADRLQCARWESLRQRIILSYHLGHLSVGDTARYVLHRRQVAAAEGCLLRFTMEAIKLIYLSTKGVPRLINSLCDNALLVGLARGQHKITSDIVATVLRDMTCWSLNGAPAQLPGAGLLEGAAEAEAEANAEAADEGTYVPEPGTPLLTDTPAESWQFIEASADFT